jgi:hypothetical protein
MKELKLLVCALALASLALFTGCGGDDNNNNNNNGNNNGGGGTNAPTTLAANSVITTTANDTTGVTLTEVDIGANNTYTAKFSDNTTETGTYVYTPSGNNATLVLTPDNNTATTTANLVFTSPTDGTYTSEAGNGTFTLTPGGGA